MLCLVIVLFLEIITWKFLGIIDDPGADHAGGFCDRTWFLEDPEAVTDVSISGGDRNQESEESAC